jgi:hypothetical protein
MITRMTDQQAKSLRLHSTRLFERQEKDGSWTRLSIRDMLIGDIVRCRERPDDIRQVESNPEVLPNWLTQDGVAWTVDTLQL